MSVKNKTSLKPVNVWQRHALSKACVLAIASASVGSAAWAEPGAALSLTYGTIVGAGAQTLQSYWPSPLSSSGYNSQWVNPQVGSADIMAPITNATYFSSLTGSGSYPVSILGNSVLTSVLGNQASSTMTTLNRTGASNDGDLSLNLQIFTGLVNTGGSPTFGTNVSALAQLDNTSLTDGTVYIKQVGLDSADLSLSNNSMGASAGFNSLTTAVTVATPIGYTSTSKGSSSLSFTATGSAMGSPATPTAGSTGSVNLSNLQGAFNAAGTAEVKGVVAQIAVSGTSGTPGNLDKAIDLNGNSISATSNSNSAVSVFTSTASSAAFTGTVGVTNSQSIASGSTAAEQYAGVSGSSVALDVRKGSSAISQVSGSISISDNTIAAQATGNTAGSQSASGSIQSGNAIVFAGSSNYTGANTTRNTDLTASIAATTANAEADLLINNAQRVASNNFTAEVVTPKVTSHLDTMSGNGSLTQSGNVLSASVTNNLAGNLISVGQSATMGSMSGSTVVLNTQQTKTVTTLAQVTGGEISAQIGYASAVDGAASLNSNTISATAQGNLAVSSVLLKADNLSVGANAGSNNNVTLTPSTNAAVSGLAVSTLNAQSNDAQDLSASNTTGSVSLIFDKNGSSPVPISATQGTVNSNQLSTTATGNSASNRTALESTNASGMNVALGSSQTNKDSTVEATSGSSATKLGIQLEAKSTVNGSQLSLSSNSISAQAQLNSVSNSLSTTLTNTSGVGGMLTNASSPSAIVGDLTTGTVMAKADFALANAQKNTDSAAAASTYGAMTLAAGAVGNTTASTLVANSNRIVAAAEGNSASNAMNLANANMSGMTAALASGQLLGTTPIESATVGDIEVSTGLVGAASKSSSVSVNDNVLNANTVGNAVTNSLAVTATTASGRAVSASSASPTKTIASGSTADVKADFALSNSQVLTQSGVVTDAENNIYSDLQGSVKVTTTGDVKGASAITLDANTMTASSMGNTAGNTLNLGVGQLSQADMALGSMQTATLADIKASNTASSIELSAAAANISEGAKLTVTNNLLKSTAVANTVTNQVTLTGTNFTAPALTLADKGAEVGVNSTVVATSALANQQTSSANTLTSSVGTSATPSSVQLLANAVSGTSALTLSDNTLASVAYNNNATNGMTLSVTNATGATGALASRQSVVANLSGSSLAETFGSVKLDAGAVTGTDSAKPNLTVNGNSITADNVGNAGVNQMTVTASQWDGRVTDKIVPNASVGTGLNTTASADLALANQQNIMGAAASTAVITATVEGTVENNNFLEVIKGNITSNANTVSAAATGNTATNALTMSSTGMTGTTTGVASLQVMDSGKISSAATTGTLDVGAKGGDVIGSNVSVNSNAVQATARANAVNNSLSVTATNATGTTATVVPTSSYNLTTMALVADSALVNNQGTLTSNVVAEVGTSSASARIKSEVYAVSLNTSASNLTLNSNNLASAAYANQATNALTVAVNNASSMTAGLGNAQRADSGSLQANTYGTIDTQLLILVESSATVNNNAITASASGNTASNGLGVSGSNAAGRSVQPSFTTTESITVADLVLNNAQVFSNNALTATTDGTVKLMNTGAVSGASAQQSNLSLNANTVSAYGSSNYANNTLLVTPSNLSNATSALVSSQVATRTSVDSVVTRANGSLLLQAAAVSDANLAMNSNTIKSTALDNVAVNQVALVGTTATGDASLTMAGVQSPITLTNASSVASDLSLINLQTSIHNGDMKARTGYSAADNQDAVNVTLQVDGAPSPVGSNPTSITANANTVSSLLYANNASNTLGMNVTTATAMTAALSNSQQVDNGALTSYTRGDILLKSTSAVNTANLTLNNNNVTATAGANDVGNVMTVTATDLIGRDLSNRETSVGSFQVLKDFALANQQQLISGTTVEAKATGDVHMDVGSNTIDSGRLTLSGNTLSATGSANNATNALTVSATNISKASVGLASEQTLDTATSVKSVAEGSIKMTGGVTTDSALTAADNTIKSTALGNLATNTLTATASNFTGPTSSTVRTEVAAGTTSVAADFAIANKQTNTSTSDIKAETFGTVQMALSDVNGSNSSSSSNSLTGNALKALAQSNSASNELKLTVTELRSATAGVASYQKSAAAVNASVEPDANSSSLGLFAVTSGAVTEGSITVSGNAASALAGMNEVANTLTVAGSNILGRGLNVLAPTVGTVSSTGADFAVMNTQSGSGSAEASLNAGASGFTSTANFSSGSVTVNGNSLLARASANTANNTLTLAATNRLEASGVVNNLQEMANGATSKASIASTSAVGVELASTSGGAVVTVKDNTVTAQATGNVANNALNASANNAMTSAGASVTPTFAVLNYQSTGTAPSSPAYGVQSIINGISVGGSQLGGALNGGSATVAGNQVLSVAYGNSANNSVVVSALTPTLNTASASITSVQYNLTSVTATIGATTVQASGAAGSSGANVGITGNSIVAMAVGNRSVNAITGR